MTCSTSSSSRGLAGLSVVLALAALAAPPAAAGEPVPVPVPVPVPAPLRLADLPPELPAGGPIARLALLPPENLTGRPVDTAPLLAALELALADAGMQVVAGEPVERFLARRRIRSTAGLPGRDSAAARAELGVEAVLVTSLVELDPGDPPRLSVLARLVSAEEDPVIYWMGGATRTGEDRPGLLQLGMVRELAPLRVAVVQELAASLAAYLGGGPAGEVRCEGGRRFRPRLAYRNLVPPEERVASVAVLPFRNQAAHPSAGEAVALELVRQLVAAGRFRIMEPAVVRDELLRRRILIPEGMSDDTARLLLGTLQVDYLVSGTVLRYADVRGVGAEPDAEFTTTMMETRTARIAWQSTSAARGGDGVFLFDLGRVRSGEDLTCRLAREVVAGIVGGGAWPARAAERPARPEKQNAKPALPAPDTAGARP